jgi:beta-phosphoglucomutase
VKGVGVAFRNVQAVSWDVDGTLVDTAELHFQAWLALARERKFPFSRADFQSTFGWRNQEIIPQLFGITEAEEVEKIGQRKEDLYRQAAQQGVALLPGVRQLLDFLKNSERRQAIGSSAPRANVELILLRTQIVAYFDAIVSMEDSQKGKPDPEVFLIAARRLGVSPASCLVIEDAPVGIQAAKAGGMQCLAVTHAGHHPPDQLIQAGADWVVKSLEEVKLNGWIG